MRLYFALRAYDGPAHQVGSEPTPAAYLEALWAATAEMVRVLKPSGSIFVDLGDKYSGSPANMPQDTQAVAGRKVNSILGLKGRPEPTYDGIG